MKKFQKIALGLMVGAMAIGFSAFTNAQKKSASLIYRYYSTTGAVNDTNPADFVYESNPDLCSTSTTKECSAEWSTTNAPTAGQTPSQAGSPTYVGSTSLGIYP